jgi:hypothetical protein
MDITGSTLLKSDFSARENHAILNQLEYLPAGFYLLEINIDNGSETRKLLKK